MMIANLAGVYPLLFNSSFIPLTSCFKNSLVRDSCRSKKLIKDPMHGATIYTQEKPSETFEWKKQYLMDRLNLSRSTIT